MPRPERALGGEDGAVARFAADLRRLRQEAGAPTYRSLALRANYSAAALASAASGRRLPTLAVALAYVAACGGDQVEWEARWRALAGEGADVAGRLEGQDAGPVPYRGLAAFGADDAGWFFGREALVEQLLGRLSGQRFLAVFGPSGVGKSSLLRAGLVPAARQGRLAGGRSCPAVVMTPGAHPWQELAVTLAALSGIPAGAIVDELSSDPARVHLIVRQVLAVEPPEVDLLLVVDQFEELFTQCEEPAERDGFLEAILGMCHAPRIRTRVVLGIRADFYARCAEHPELVQAFADVQVLVGAMDGPQVREAVVKPAERAGLMVEGALVSAVVAEVAGRAGALPLASHALLEAWRRRRGATITLAGYEAAGGIDGAVAKTAETVYLELDAGSQGLVRQVLLRLIHVGHDGELTRRRVVRQELTAMNAGSVVVVDGLVAARLLSLDRDTVEIVHEALIRAWPRLRAWVDEDLDGLRMHRQLTAAAEVWESSGRDPGALYQGMRLSVAGQWVRSRTVDLNASEQQFLTASQRREHRRRRVIGAIVASFATLALIVAGIAVVAVNNATRAADHARAADHQHALALSRQLAAQSRALRTNQRATSLRLAAAALHIGRTDEAVAEASEALADYRHRLPRTAQVTAVAFSPDGKLLAVADVYNAVQLWDLATGTPTSLPLTGASVRDIVTVMAFSPDGKLLATAGGDDSILLWSLATRTPVKDIGTAGHTNRTAAVAFSPDGKLLASINDNGMVRLWNLATDAPTGVLLAAHTKGVTAVAFSPNGKLLAAAGSDDTIRLWDLSTRTVAQVIRTGHSGSVSAVAFSPDGKVLTATDSQDVGAVRLWNQSTGGPVDVIETGHTNRLSEMALSPGGKLLATVSEHEGTVRLWNVATRTPVDVIEADRDNFVHSVVLSPDGRLLVTASFDNTVSSSGKVQLWGVAAGMPIGAPIIIHINPVYAVALSPDGKLLATAGDGIVRFWNPATGAPVGVPITIDADRVGAVMFSPDGKLLATVNSMGAVQLWNPATGVPATGVPTPAAFPDGSGVLDVAFSPDGKLLAATSGAGVRLWNLATGTLVRAPLNDHTESLSAVAFSPDGKLLASAGRDGMVRMLNPSTGAPVTAFTTGRYSRTAVAVAFSPDGKLLATTGEDSVVRIWNPSTGTLAGIPLTGHTGSVSAVAFSPDGKLLASADGAEVRLWNPALYIDPIRSLCQKVGGITKQEWTTYAAGEPNQRICLQQS